MKNVLKKLYLFIVVICTILNLQVCALADADSTKTVQTNSSSNLYTDLDSTHWAYNSIKELTDSKVIVGYPDGSFKPDENVTRAEFATMAIKALKQENYKVETLVTFNDINDNFWAFNNIQRAVYFDLLKGLPNGSFLPQDPVSKAQAISVVINSLTTDEMSISEAEAILNENYKDVKQIPNWVSIFAAKATKLGIINDKNNVNSYLNIEQPATRAQLASYLCKMIELTKVTPNEKLKEAMKRTGNGLVINGVEINGNIATIPQGTLLPVCLTKSISSQKNKNSENFNAHLTQNIIDENKYLLLDQGDILQGQLLDVKKARLFIRNGYIIIENRNIKTPLPQVAQFPALSEQKVVINGFWKNLFNKIFKGKKIELQSGKTINIKLLQPIRIDLTDGSIIE